VFILKSSSSLKMAKSLRSKWKRKMRAVKRERYDLKERARLSKMLDEAKKDKEEEEKRKEESEDIHDPQPLGEKERPNVGSADARLVGADDEETMDTTKAGQGGHSVRSKRNEHGSYPVWMSHRKIQAAKKAKKAKGGGAVAKEKGKVKKNNKRKFL